MHQPNTTSRITNEKFDLLRAIRFAAERHAGQRRKDGTGATPYINHPIAVAELLAGIGQVDDLVLLQAAILHDTVEDTGTTPEELESLFGTEVRDIVLEVTDNKALPKAERKRLQELHAPHLSSSARQLAVSDKAINCADITDTVPSGWNLERKAEYLAWASRIVNKCRGQNQALEAYFDQVLADRRSSLGLARPFAD